MDWIAQIVLLAGGFGVVFLYLLTNPLHIQPPRPHHLTLFHSRINIEFGFHVTAFVENALYILLVWLQNVVSFLK